jgi:hypothetical protein
MMAKKPTAAELEEERRVLLDMVGRAARHKLLWPE